MPLFVQAYYPFLQSYPSRRRRSVQLRKQTLMKTHSFQSRPLLPAVAHPVLVRPMSVIPRATKDLMLQRDRDTCQACGKRPAAQPHHVIPRRDGGSDELSNLATLCGRCHMLISDTPPKALWRAFRIRTVDVPREREQVLAAIARWRQQHRTSHSSCSRSATRRPNQPMHRTAGRCDV